MGTFQLLRYKEYFKVVLRLPGQDCRMHGNRRALSSIPTVCEVHGEIEACARSLPGTRAGTGEAGAAMAAAPSEACILCRRLMGGKRGGAELPMRPKKNKD